MGSSLSRPTKNITLTDLTVQSSLTVDQTTLTVDDANDRVGVGTTLRLVVQTLEGSSDLVLTMAPQ